MATYAQNLSRAVSLVSVLVAAIGLAVPVKAVEPILVPGQPIITGFSGVVGLDAPPAGSDPADMDFIDTDGASMRMLALQPAGSPTGQVIETSETFRVTAADVGQVFGITLDNAPELEDALAPNVYLAASSAYGLNITVPGSGGNPARIKLGDPAAEWMTGQWGAADGATGYPGSIWKVDGTTGEVSLFSTITNAGPGLGDIVYDPSSAQFFVSDLDTGLIYRLASDGVIIDTFDHGVDGRPTHGLDAVADDGSTMSITDPAFNTEDPATWGFTQNERRVFGLAAEGGRLYYSVRDALQVWSVRIEADGSFGEARWEFDVTGAPSANEITDMVFDPQGKLILAQRGAQVASYDYTAFAETGTSAVLRFEREFPDNPTTPGTWVPEPESYAIGVSAEGLNAAGGIALGPKYDDETGTFDGARSGFIWATGDALRVNPDIDPPLTGATQIAGLQGNARSLIRPQNDLANLSFFVDVDGNTEENSAPEANLLADTGHTGGIAIWQASGEGEVVEEDYVPPTSVPPEDFVPEENVNLSLEKWSKPYFCTDAGANWLCHYTIRVENTGDDPYWGPVVVNDHLPANNPGASMYFWNQPPWACGATGPTAYQCAMGPVLLYPGDGVVLHETVKLPKALVDYCQLVNVASLDWFWTPDDDASDDFGVGVAGIKAPGCVPPAGSDLTLKKIAAPNCVDAGAAWNCSYAVIVQNAGPGNYSGPIQVKDTLAVNAPATTFGPWTCGQVGPVLTCNINAAPVNVPPGWTSGFIVTAKVVKNVGAPLCELDNKANIATPAGGSPTNFNGGNDFDQAAANIPDPGCLIAAPNTDLEMKKSALGCVNFVYMATPGYLCKWRVKITNVGPDNYHGPISFVDTSIGATLDTLKLTYPFCTGPHAKVTCEPPFNVTINAGASSQTQFFTFYPGGPDVCSVTNNLSILNPAPGSASNPGGNDSSTVGQAVPNPGCFAPGTPKLNIQKTAMGCASDPASPDWLCEFEVKVLNYGSAAQPGPIQVKDFNDKPTTFTGAACAPSGVNQWLCTRAAPLNPGQTWTFEAITRVNPNSVSLADCNVTNTVLITNPAAADPGHFSQANQKVPQLFINVGPGPVAVYCDPPSLKLAKTAVKTVKSGDGYDATFTVRATSTGPDPYIGTVEIEELLPDGASYVSSNWTCVPTTSNDMHCSSPFKTIPVGKYTQMTFTMHIPADVAKAAKCNVVNTATAAISAEVLHSDEGVQYSASASAQLPASLCRETTDEPLPQCKVSQKMPDGGCCPDGTQWNGKQCAKPRPTQEPKDEPKDEPTAPKCPADSHLNKAGKCVCDAGTEGKPGKCKPIVEDEPEVPSCPADSRLRRGECQCLPGTEGRPGKCQPIVEDEPEAPSCPADSRLRRGECQCLPGTEGRPGKCRPIVEDEPEAPSCPSDSRLSRGQCVCLPGLEGKPGNCQPVVEEIEPEDTKCPKGTILRRGRCIELEQDLPTLQLDQSRPVLKFPTIN